jgi:AraC-like DNA-binding protein
VARNPESSDLVVNYGVEEGEEYPYVSLHFQPNDSSLFDIASSDLILDIESPRDNELVLRTGFFVDDFTDRDNSRTILFTEESLHIKKGVNSFLIPFEEVDRTPFWWYTDKEFSENDRPAFLRTNTIYLAIMDVNVEDVGIDQSYSLKALKSVPNYSSYFLYSLLISVCYYLVLVALYFIRKRKIQKVLVPIDHEDSRESANVGEALVQFIGSNYRNPKLKIADVAKAIGIAEDSVSIEIKQLTDSGFRPYLNFIRIERAKELLMNSELQVAEIAYEVGYNSAHHFIRVFKELESKTPAVYRAGVLP